MAIKTFRDLIAWQKAMNTSQAGIPRDGEAAGKRAVRANITDAQSRDIDPLKHCRGIRAAESHGLRSLPKDGARLPGRASDATDPERGPEFPAALRKGKRFADRNRPSTPGPDPQPGTPPEPDPSCLRAYVPSCLRLGFRIIRGLSADKIAGVLAERAARPIRSIHQLARRRDVSRDTLVRLAAGDAFRSLGLSRREALWQILSLSDDDLPLFAELEPDEPPAELPPMPLDETVVHDYDAVGFSLNAHPIELVRDELQRLKVTPNGELRRRAQRSAGQRRRPCRRTPAARDGEGHRVYDARRRNRRSPTSSCTRTSGNATAASLAGKSACSSRATSNARAKSCT